MSADGPIGTLPLVAILARWDGLVIRWGLTPEERSLMLGCFDGGAIDDVATYRTAEAELRMRLLLQLEPILVQLHGSEKRIRTWLRRGNSSMDDRSPLQMMARSTEWTRWLIANYRMEP